MHILIAVVDGAFPCQEKPGSIFFGVFPPRICFCDWDSSAGSASFLCGWEIYLESSKTTAVFILELWLMLTRNNSIICMSSESRLNPERSLNYSDSTGLIPLNLYHPLAPVKPHQTVPFFIKKCVFILILKIFCINLPEPFVIFAEKGHKQVPSRFAPSCLNNLPNSVSILKSKQGPLDARSISINSNPKDK